MAVFHRKLMNATIEDSNDLCRPYCEPERNHLGFCPPDCIPYCYPICDNIFVDPVPPDVVTKTINQPTPGNQNGNNGHPSMFLIMFLIMIISGFSIFLCHTISKFCKSSSESRREASEDEEQQEQNGPPGSFPHQELDLEVANPIWYIRTDGLHPSVINSITIFKFKKDNDFVVGAKCNVCSVCLNNFQEGETLRQLPKCNHAYHVPCIDAWLKSHKNCPTCRADIVFHPPVGLPSSSPHSPDQH